MEVECGNYNSLEKELNCVRLNREKRKMHREWKRKISL